MVPGIVAVAWAYASYLWAYFLYPFFAWQNTNAGQYLRLAITAVGVALLIYLMVRLKRKYPDSADVTAMVFIGLFIPFGGISLFAEWTYTLLIIPALAIAIMSIKATLVPLIAKAEEKIDSLAVVGILIYLFAAFLCFMVFVGVLWNTASQWAYTARKVVDTRQSKLFGEFGGLEALRGKNRVEYAKITNTDLALDLRRTETFGMGESAYRETYALLFDKKKPYRDVSTWPFWYHCKNGDCELKNPLYVAIDRCDEGTCPQDFFTVLAQILEKKIGEQTPSPAAMLLLSPAPELGFTPEIWRSKIEEGLLAVLIVQLCHTLGCMALAFTVLKTR